MMLYAGLNSYEKETVGIIGNRKKDWVRKNREGVKKVPVFLQKKILKKLKFFEMVKNTCIF